MKTWTAPSGEATTTFKQAARLPCLYLWHGTAKVRGEHDPATTVGYTGLSRGDEARPLASLAKLSRLPDFARVGMSIVTVLGATGPARDRWLRMLEAELIADQVLRRYQAQLHSAAPAAVTWLTDQAWPRPHLTRAVNRLLAVVREHETALGLTTAPWEACGSENLRDLGAVTAHHLQHQHGWVGTLDDLIDTATTLFASAAGRDIACPRDSFGRNIRNREPQLLLPRYALIDGLVHTTGPRR